MSKTRKSKLFAVISSSAIVAGTALTVTSCSTTTPSTIEAAVTIVGPDNVNVKCHETKQIDYTALVKPITFSQDVIWTSTPIPDEYADKVWFSNGVLSMVEVDTMGSFDFTITASSRIDPTKTNTEKVTVNIVNADVESVKIKSAVVLEEGNIFEANAGKEGGLTFTAAAEPLEASQQFRWTKGPEFKDVKDKIHFTSAENAIVSVDDDLQPKRNDKGEIIPYEVSFTATSLADPTKEDTFKLNLLIQPAKVTSVVITGPQSIVETTSSGIKDFDYTAKVEPKGLVSQEVTWSVENSTGNSIEEVASINPNSGKLTYTPLSIKTPAIYKGKIVATPKDYEQGAVVGKIDIEIIVNEVRPTDIAVTGFSENPITINAVVGTASTTQQEKTFSADVQPVGEILQEATKVKWNSSETPSGVTFKDNNDNTASLSWTADTKPGTYSFNIWANCAEEQYQDICSQQQKIIFNITRPDPTNITVSGDSSITIAEQTKVDQAYSATVSPTHADQTVAWSISDYGTLTSDEISIDDKTGVLTMNVVSSNTYNIKVRATSTVKDSIFKDYPITLNVSDTPVKEIIINGVNAITTEHGTGGSESYTTTVIPTSAPSGVTWSATYNGSTTLPTGVTFVNGTLTYGNNVASGSYLIVLTATSTSDPTIKTDFNVSLIVNQETPTTIEISGNGSPLEIYGGENKTLQLSATVKPTGAKQQVKWSLGNNAPTGVSIDPDSGLVSTGTQLEYTSTTGEAYTEYTIPVIATSVATTTLSQTANVLVHVKQTAPTSVNIQGLDTINIQNNVTPPSKTTSYLAVVTPSQASQEVTWESTWDQAHDGLSFDNDTGILRYCDEGQTVTAAVGTYTLYLTATTKAQPQLKSATKAVKINVASATISDINITCPQYGTGGVEAIKGVGGSTQLVANITPTTASQSVRWSVATEGYGNQVTVDQNGLVSWNFNQVISGATFDIEIKATSTVQSGKEGNFTFHFTVDYADPAYITIEGMPSITLAYGSDEIEVPYAARVYPSNADQSVTWSSITSGLPDGVVWDNATGILKVNSGQATPSGTYIISIQATSDAKPTLKETYNIEVNITATTSESIDISGETQFNVIKKDGATAVDKYYIAVVNPVGAIQQVTWKATYQDSETLPTGITFDKDKGKLSVNPNQLSISKGEYVIRITASQGTTLTSDPLDVTINVYTDPGTLTLNSTGASDIMITEETGWENLSTFTLTDASGNTYTEPVWYELVDTQGQKSTINPGLYAHESSSNPEKGILDFNREYLGNEVIQFRVKAVPQDGTQRVVLSDVFTIKYENSMTLNGKTWNLRQEIDPNLFCTTTDGTNYKTVNIPLKDGTTTQQITYAEGYTGLNSLELRHIKSTEDTIQDYFLSGLYSIQSLILENFNNIKYIGNYFIAKLNPLPQPGVDFMSLNINSLTSLETIGTNFLAENHNVNTLTLPATWNVNTIGDNFMYDATALLKVIMPITNASSMTIGKYFMYNCWDLTQVNLGNIMLSYFPEDSEENNKWPFAADKLEAKCYSIGITIDGDDKTAIVGRFGDSSTEKYFRKTAVGTVPR